MNERIENMKKEKREKDAEKVNLIKNTYVFSENAKDNYNKNVNLFQLNEKSIVEILGKNQKNYRMNKKCVYLIRKLTIVK